MLDPLFSPLLREREKKHPKITEPLNMNEVPQLLSFSTKACDDDECPLLMAKCTLTCAFQFVHAGRRGELQDSLTSLSGNPWQMTRLAGIIYHLTHFTAQTVLEPWLRAYHTHAALKTNTQNLTQVEPPRLRESTPKYSWCCHSGVVAAAVAGRNGCRRHGESDVVMALKCVDRLSQLRVHQHVDELEGLMIHCH